MLAYHRGLSLPNWLFYQDGDQLVGRTRICSIESGSSPLPMLVPSGARGGCLPVRGASGSKNSDRPLGKYLASGLCSIQQNYLSHLGTSRATKPLRGTSSSSPGFEWAGHYLATLRVPRWLSKSHEEAGHLRRAAFHDVVSGSQRDGANHSAFMILIRMSAARSISRRAASPSGPMSAVAAIHKAEASSLERPR
jgi:hypothetical protein